MSSDETHKTPVEARQGSGRRMNFRVLLWSMLGVILAFGLIYLFFFVFQSPPPNTTTGV